MRSLISRLRHKGRGAKIDSVPGLQEVPSETAQQRLYRYRKQRGVNLGKLALHGFSKPVKGDSGSWFVLERWISESPFKSAVGSGQSDLDVAKGSNAKQVLEDHWDSWITPSDFEWLAARGINTVRIPVRSFL
jgi:glucan 1,3-beta-glucosidase